MMKLITNILGGLLVLTALIGFAVPEFMGMALNTTHNIFLLLAGAATLYFGITGTEFQARYTCRTVGIAFTLLGVATLFAGAGTATAQGVDITSDHVLKLIPDHLEYTTADGIRDLTVGILGLVAGFFPREQEISIDMAAHDIKQKVASGKR